MIAAVLISVVMLFLLVGCWDVREVKDYSFVSLIGIEKVDDNIKFHLQLRSTRSRSSDSQSGASNKSEILVSEGTSFTEARTSYLRGAEKGVYLGSVRAIVFSNNFSKGGIEEYFNRLRGSREFNKSPIYIFTTNTNLEKLLSESQAKETNIGDKLKELTRGLVKQGMLDDSILTKEMENALVKHTGYVLNNIDKINEKIKVNGYSIFKDNKKVGFIPESGIRGINYFILRKPYNEYTIDFEGVSVAFSALVKHKEIESYYDGRNINFMIRVSLRCEIINFSKMINLSYEKKKELQNIISELVKQEMLDTIKASQEKYGCDYLQLYRAFREKYNSDFRNMNWNEKYMQANYNVIVKTEVKTANLINLE